MKDELFEYKKNALLGKISGQPLCSTYTQAWRACGNDREMLVRLALSQQSLPHFMTSCYRKLGLSKKYILENFGEYINGNRLFYDVEGVKGYSYEMYVGFSGIMDVRSDVVAFMWADHASVSVPMSKAPVIYVGCDSHLHVSLEGYNMPRIYLFDGSSVEIADGDDESKVIVYKYSGDAKVSTGDYCFSEIKIFDKELKL